MALFSKIRSREEFILGPEVKSLQIDGSNGAITWVPVDGGAARVVAEKEVRGLSVEGLEHILADLRVESTSLEGTMILRAIMPSKSFGINASIAFTVYASPDQIGDFQGHTSNGAISVGVPFSGKLNLRTSNGRIELQAGSGEINAATSNGSIRFSKILLQGTSSLRTSNGAIVGQTEFAEDGTYRFQTSNGAIELRIPHDSPGSFEARTSNGSIEFRVGDDQVGGRKRVALERSAHPQVTMATSNGSISVLGY